LDENRSNKELREEFIELRKILNFKEESLKKFIHNQKILSQTALPGRNGKLNDYMGREVI
jgi:hypothetical protein